MTSFYFNNVAFAALRKEVILFKSNNIQGPRSSIEKNLKYILEEFINDNKKHNEFSEFYNNECEYESKAYPLNIDNNILEKVQNLMTEIAPNSKIHIFINNIILFYYANNRKSILKEELSFWKNFVPR